MLVADITDIYLYNFFTCIMKYLYNQKPYVNDENGENWCLMNQKSKK